MVKTPLAPHRLVFIRAHDATGHVSLCAELSNIGWAGAWIDAVLRNHFVLALLPLRSLHS